MITVCFCFVLGLGVCCELWSPLAHSAMFTVQQQGNIKRVPRFSTSTVTFIFLAKLAVLLVCHRERKLGSNRKRPVMPLALSLCACHVSKMLCERPLALESAVVGVMIGESNSDDTPLSPPLELLLLP